MENKKGRLSNDEKLIIRKMIEDNKSVTEISKFLNRKEQIVLKQIALALEQSSKKSKKSTTINTNRENNFVDDFTLALKHGDIPLLQTEDEKKNFTPQERRKAPRKIKATCRHCGKEGKEWPQLVLNKEYSCEECLRGKA